MGLNAKQWGAILIAALFGFSFIGYIGIGNNSHGATPANSNSAGSTLEYNGHTFSLENNYWVTNIGGQERYFLNPPTALESFSVPNNTAEILSNGKIYLSYDPQNAVDLAALQPIAYTFFSPYGVQTFPACTQEEGCPDIPVIDCSEDHAIVFFMSEEETSITAQDNCLELRALNIATMQRQIERTFYTALGIME